MCGRYIVTSPLDVLRQRFGFEGEAAGYRPRFNLAPRQEAPVVVDGGEGRRLRMMWWGLVPSWTKEIGKAGRPINARAETAPTLASFRSPFRSGRGLVLADGFLEWRAVTGEKRKTPVLFRRREGGPFALAGLTDRWRAPDGTELESFAILTVPPNELVAKVHDRMPAMLRPADEGAWLDRATPVERVASMLAPFPPGELEAFELGPAIGSAAADRPDLIVPVRPLR